MEDNKKAARFRKSATTIADLLSKEGASLVVPLGGIIYEATKALVNHGRSYFKDRTENRIKDFHAALIDGNANDAGFESFINKAFDLDDYYAVLSSCTQDIENEKVENYSNLMTFLIKSDIEADLRRHFIKSCKELTFSELQFLRNIYINSKYDLMTPGGINQQQRKMLTISDDMQRIIVDRIKSFGFIDENSSRLSSIGEKFVLAIFKPQSFSPESIGRESYTGINIAIISYQLGAETHSTVANQIHEALWRKQIKSNIHLIDIGNVMNSTLYSSAGVLLIDEKPIDSKYKEALARFSEKNIKRDILSAR